MLPNKKEANERQKQRDKNSEKSMWISRSELFGDVLFFHDVAAVMAS